MLTEIGEFCLRVGALRLRRLNFHRRLDQGGVEPRVIDFQRFDVGLNLAALFFGRFQRVLDASEFRFFRGFGIRRGGFGQRWQAGCHRRSG